MKRIFSPIILSFMVSFILNASANSLAINLGLLETIKDGPNALTECQEEKEEDPFEKLSASSDKEKDWDWLFSWIAQDPFEQDSDTLDLEIMMLKHSQDGKKRMRFILPYGKCVVQMSGAYGLNKEQTRLRVAEVNSFVIFRPKEPTDTSPESTRFNNGTTAYLPIVSIKDNPGIDSQTLPPTYLDPVRSKIDEIKNKCR